jgi:hypothetical protein
VPGMSAFHATFCVELQVSGRFTDSATPSDSDPRNCGQRSMAGLAVPARHAVTTIAILEIPIMTGDYIKRPLSSRRTWLDGRHDGAAVLCFGSPIMLAEAGDQLFHEVPNTIGCDAD